MELILIPAAIASMGAIAERMSASVAVAAPREMDGCRAGVGGAVMGSEPLAELTARSEFDSYVPDSNSAKKAVAPAGRQTAPSGSSRSRKRNYFQTFNRDTLDHQKLPGGKGVFDDSFSNGEALRRAKIEHKNYLPKPSETHHPNGTAHGLIVPMADTKVSQTARSYRYLEKPHTKQFVQDARTAGIAGGQAGSSGPLGRVDTGTSIPQTKRNGDLMHHRLGFRQGVFKQSQNGVMASDRNIVIKREKRHSHHPYERAPRPDTDNQLGAGAETQRGWIHRINTEHDRESAGARIKVSEKTDTGIHLARPFGQTANPSSATPTLDGLNESRALQHVTPHTYVRRAADQSEFLGTRAPKAPLVSAIPEREGGTLELREQSFWLPNSGHNFDGTVHARRANETVFTSA